MRTCGILELTATSALLLSGRGGVTVKIISLEGLAGAVAAQACITAAYKIRKFISPMLLSSVVCDGWLVLSVANCSTRHLFYKGANTCWAMPVGCVVPECGLCAGFARDAKRACIAKTHKTRSSQLFPRCSRNGQT